VRRDQHAAFSSGTRIGLTRSLMVAELGKRAGERAGISAKSDDAEREHRPDPGYRERSGCTHHTTCSGTGRSADMRFAGVGVGGLVPALRQLVMLSGWIDEESRRIAFQKSFAQQLVYDVIGLLGRVESSGDDNGHSPSS